MPDLTVVDHEVLADIHKDGGFVIVTNRADDQPEYHTRGGVRIGSYRFHRLLAAGLLVPCGAGLLADHPTTYRVA